MAALKKASTGSPSAGRKKAASKSSKAPTRRRPRPAAVGSTGLPKPATDAQGFPRRIFAVASPHSVGGVSLFTPDVIPDASTVGSFASDDALVERAVERLSQAGFDVLQATPLMINIAGSRSTFERAFQTTLVSQDRLAVKGGGVVEEATCFDSPDTSVFGLISTDNTDFADVLEGVAIEQPSYPQTANTFPPPVDYWHLDVPADVSLGCNADKVHRSGVTGLGVRVAMVDTGQFAHPFFSQRGYRVEPTVLGPGTVDPAVDSVGHGTGESANIFATAPDVTLLPVKTANASGALINTTAAFNAAVALNPAIITNSWSRTIGPGPLDAAAQALAAAVAAAVAAGIVVCFSSSNGGWGFPAQHPDVIAVGGVFMNPDGSMQASDYSSGFNSVVYAGRRVPDVSGLVGMRPRAIYIMLPLAEGSSIDVGQAGGTHPNGDETANNDGWAAFSGTSASCPQIAGVCALIKQVCPHLRPAQVRDILMRTARDVTTGTSSGLRDQFGTLTPGNPAAVGPDTATGDGLVDAYRAVLLAKLRCLVVPFVPFIPPVVIPRPPIVPIVSPQVLPIVTPRPPIVPIVSPRVPLLPIITPRVPFLPPVLTPLTPLLPFGPGPGPGPAPEPLAEAPALGLTAEDVAALEQLIIEEGESPF